MTIDEAIVHLDPQHVRDVLNSGVAHDEHNTLGLHGRGVTASMANDFVTQLAYVKVMVTEEALVRQACRPLDELREAMLEGSGRAMAELARRGLPLPMVDRETAFL